MAVISPGWIISLSSMASSNDAIAMAPLSSPVIITSPLVKSLLPPMAKPVISAVSRFPSELVPLNVPVALVAPACDIVTVSGVVSSNPLSEFNMVPFFTAYTFADPLIKTLFSSAIVEGAYVIALASQSLVEKGRDFQEIP